MMMERKNYASGAPKEAAIGYSRVVKTGPFIEVGGTTSVQSDGSVYAEDDTYGQMKYVLEKQIKLVEEAGGKREDIYKLKIFCTPKYNPEDAMKALKEIFQDVKPVCTITRIYSLVRPQQVVEIELSACIGCGIGTEWEGIQLAKKVIPFENTNIPYSAAIKMGPFIYVSGRMAEDDVFLQANQNNADAQDDDIYSKEMRLVEALGGSAKDVIKIDSTAVAAYKTCRNLQENTYYKKYFKPVKPLHTMVYVPQVGDKDQLVQHEIYAIEGCGGIEKLSTWGNLDFRKLKISSGSPLEDKAGYSRVIKTGPFVYCGGTTSVLPDGSVAKQEDSLGQESFVIDKFMKLLEPIGVSAAEVVACRAYRTPHYNIYKKEEESYYSKILKPVRPLYTGLFIQELTRPAQLVEFEMNAVIGCSK